ncbi:MAG: hypothetical protein KDA58_09585 [Planctomycetaceae bacterium]|nr:hypothetical protein [Planctomycetaceae bacterium]
MSHSLMPLTTNPLATSQQHSAMQWTPRSPHDLAGKRVTVMGLGRFGGGLGVVRFLLSHSAAVTLTDLLPKQDLVESLDQIKVDQLRHLRLGGHDVADFTDADLVIVNPAVRPGNKFVDAAITAGVPISTELNLFWSLQRGRVAAVTGTVGKSTTSALLAHILRETGHSVRLGGNIGGSLLSEVDQIGPADWTVLELSSFQLERLRPLRPRPEVALCTNFFANHLDWHGTLEHYRQAKQVLAESMTANQLIVAPPGSEILHWPTAARCLAAEPFIAESPLPGAHQQQNLSLVATVCREVFGLNDDRIRAACRTFVPLPHRLERLPDLNQRQFWNDSKATTPEAAIEALQAFPQPIRLIAGGADKGVDLTALAAAIGKHAASVSLLGATTNTLADLLAQQGASLPISRADSLSEAVELQWRLSQPGDVILLSPGCASFGEFRNYEDRGNAFRVCVTLLR